MAYPLAFVRGEPGGFDELLSGLDERRGAGARLVTAGGCFDLLHAGHARHLEEAGQLGEVLVVVLNSDASAAIVKGPGRPIVPQQDRARLLCSLRAVDAVVVFDEPTPERVLSLLRPDVHCKGGDYAGRSLPEEQAVRAGGGEIRILPRYPDASSSGLAAQTARLALSDPPIERGDGASAVESHLLRAALGARNTAARLGGDIAAAGELVAERLAAGGKVLLCGNGGSAADAQHAAGEFVGRFRTEAALPAIALTADSGSLTGIANDFGFERVFERQVEALGRPADVLIALSASGRSENVCRAAVRAREQGLATIGITGREPVGLGAHCDICLDLPEDDVPLVQHLQMLVLHAIADIAEQRLTAGPSSRRFARPRPAARPASL